MTHKNNDPNDSQKLSQTQPQQDAEKSKVHHNHFHNILRLFDVLQTFPFTTSETIRDYYL